MVKRITQPQFENVVIRILKDHPKIGGYTLQERLLEYGIAYTRPTLNKKLQKMQQDGFISIDIIGSAYIYEATIDYIDIPNELKMIDTREVYLMLHKFVFQQKKNFDEISKYLKSNGFDFDDRVLRHQLALLSSYKWISLYCNKDTEYKMLYEIREDNQVTVKDSFTL